ncbi:Sterol O-acyltransferase 2 [Nakaseomyces bracarensis]|uniref:O-acyltransferase n=1 Tax=Nakaseomyces bracarensis TaxID=273131 RepID=A0ABR4NSI6_9SACH
MVDDILKDEDFIKIQKLNSLDGDRRHSITFDSTVILKDQLGNVKEGEAEAQAEAEAEQEEREGDVVTMDVGDEEPRKHSRTEYDYDSNEKDLLNRRVVITKDKDGKEVSFTVVKEDDGNDATEAREDKDGDHKDTLEAVINKYLKNIHQKERSRYNKKSQEYISYFGDVDFDKRPTILDSAVSEPYRTQFKGPILEKEIKEKEKLKKVIAYRTNPSHEPNYNIEVKHSPRNPEDGAPTFSGVYVLMWMVFGFAAIQSCINYYIDHGYSFKDAMLFRFMVTDLHRVFAFDMFLYAATFFVVFIQYLCKWNVISWNKWGLKIAVTYQLLFVTCALYVPAHVLNFNWIARIYVFLHSVVQVMKMHSFSFYNGYLWNILSELNFSKKHLARLKDKKDVDPKIITLLKRSYDFCSFELNYQSHGDHFPNNIGIKNYFMFTLFPTLVYQIQYPRTKSIRWGYLLEKTCATFGCIYLMVVDAQIYMFPVTEKARLLAEQPISMDFTKKFFLLWCELIPPMTLLYMLGFYLIWDAILNFFAELTMFADRYFYGDWWNCVSFVEFSRIWNVPVHKFILRHIYHSVINRFKLSKVQATLFTFMLSAVFHELAMYAIVKKWKGYLFAFQLGQFFFAGISEIPYLRKRPVLSNALFWFEMCTGPSVIILLYIVF